MEIRFFDSNECLIGVRLEQGTYGTADENGNPLDEMINGWIFSIGLGLVNIHFYSKSLKDYGQGEE